MEVDDKIIVTFLPSSHICTMTRRQYIDGSPMTYRVVDEIIHVPGVNSGRGRMRSNLFS